MAELQAIATNPIGVLQGKRRFVEEISQPWQPDPEVCSFGGGFGPVGPMPPMEGGGGGFGQMTDFGDMGGLKILIRLMMEKMKEKFMEMQKGEGNFKDLIHSALQF